MRVMLLKEWRKPIGKRGYVGYSPGQYEWWLYPEIDYIPSCPFDTKTEAKKFAKEQGWIIEEEDK